MQWTRGRPLRCVEKQDATFGAPKRIPKPKPPAHDQTGNGKVPSRRQLKRPRPRSAPFFLSRRARSGLNGTRDTAKERPIHARRATRAETSPTPRSASRNFVRGGPPRPTEKTAGRRSSANSLTYGAETQTTTAPIRSASRHTDEAGPQKTD